MNEKRRKKLLVKYINKIDEMKENILKVYLNRWKNKVIKKNKIKGNINITKKPGKRNSFIKNKNEEINNNIDNNIINNKDIENNTKSKNDTNSNLYKKHKVNGPNFVSSKTSNNNINNKIEQKNIIQIESETIKYKKQNSKTGINYPIKTKKSFKNEKTKIPVKNEVKRFNLPNPKKESPKEFSLTLNPIQRNDDQIDSLDINFDLNIPSIQKIPSLPGKNLVKKTNIKHYKHIQYKGKNNNNKSDLNRILSPSSYRLIKRNNDKDNIQSNSMQNEYNENIIQVKKRLRFEKVISNNENEANTISLNNDKSIENKDFGYKTYSFIPHTKNMIINKENIKNEDRNRFNNKEKESNINNNKVTQVYKRRIFSMEKKEINIINEKEQKIIKVDNRLVYHRRKFNIEKKENNINENEKEISNDKNKIIYKRRVFSMEKKDKFDNKELEEMEEDKRKNNYRNIFSLERKNKNNVNEQEILNDDNRENYNKRLFIIEKKENETKSKTFITVSKMETKINKFYLEKGCRKEYHKKPADLILCEEIIYKSNDAVPEKILNISTIKKPKKPSKKLIIKKKKIEEEEVEVEEVEEKQSIFVKRVIEFKTRERMNGFRFKSPIKLPITPAKNEIEVSALSPFSKISSSFYKPKKRRVFSPESNINNKTEEIRRKEEYFSPQKNFRINKIFMIPKCEKSVTINYLKKIRTLGIKNNIIENFRQLPKKEIICKAKIPDRRFYPKIYNSMKKTQNLIDFHIQFLKEVPHHTFKQILPAKIYNIITDTNKKLALMQIFYIYAHYKYDKFLIKKKYWDKWKKKIKIFIFNNNNIIHLKNISGHCFSVEKIVVKEIRCGIHHDSRVYMDCLCLRTRFCLKRIILRHYLLKIIDKKKYYLNKWYKIALRRIRPIGL